VRTRAEELQHQQAGRVLANQLHTEPRWNRPCRAFNPQILPPAPVTAALETAQDVIAAAEPALLRVLLRETVFPSIGSDVLDRFPLPAG
jgi:hypothetical protein